MWNLDKEKLTIIDFEYANLNFLGFDIASYFTECFFDYAYPAKPHFKIMDSQLLEYLKDSHNPQGEFNSCLKLYIQKQYQFKRIEGPISDEEVTQLR